MSCCGSHSISLLKVMRHLPGATLSSVCCCPTIHKIVMNTGNPDQELVVIHGYFMSLNAD